MRKILAAIDKAIIRFFDPPVLEDDPKEGALSRAARLGRERAAAGAAATNPPSKA